jgi:hypothetical protein
MQPDNFLLSQEVTRSNPFYLKLYNTAAIDINDNRLQAIVM